MTPAFVDLLGTTEVIDLTTYGRRSGQPRRIEIWWFYVDGEFVITGTPGRRDWLANVRSNPSVIVHADGQDLAATAAEVIDPDQRRRFLSHPKLTWYLTQTPIDRLVAGAPMIVIDFDDA